MTRRSELHFFPGAHTMLWVVNGHVAMRTDAWGGEEPVDGQVYDVMKPHKTTPGRYVIHSYAGYVSRRWPVSRIAWGTRLRLEGDEILYETGRRTRPWAPVRELVEDATKARVKRQYEIFYGHSRRFDPDGDGIPDRWVFNDFGTKAVRYFRDKNHNHKKDAGERLSGEMIHATSKSEAEAAEGQPVNLLPSHGCIHVSPGARDKLHAVGAFAPGTSLVIHKYTALVSDRFS